jgi:hypothetical protein
MFEAACGGPQPIFSNIFQALHKFLKEKFLLFTQIREKQNVYCVLFQVLTVASMKITTFWDTVPCSLVIAGLNYTIL